MEKAVDFLREKGLAKLQKRMGRVAPRVRRRLHTHGGKVAPWVEINCEMISSPRPTSFQNFVKDVAMQITASNPLYVKREDVPRRPHRKRKDHLQEPGPRIGQTGEDPRQDSRGKA